MNIPFWGGGQHYLDFSYLSSIFAFSPTDDISPKPHRLTLQFDDFSFLFFSGFGMQKQSLEQKLKNNISHNVARRDFECSSRVLFHGRWTCSGSEIGFFTLEMCVHFIGFSCPKVVDICNDFVPFEKKKK